MRVRWLGRAYQGALEAVLALLIMVIAGVLADGHFGTKPTFLLVGFAIGFGSFVLRLVRLLNELQRPPGGDGTPPGES
ncbi:MAG: AtpZ/AtpI family protein [Deltaproteobacteria bacterium]|nr:MAG: AtpZ/AtpI family protein [Deltaproteobacteria bacterium]